MQPPKPSSKDWHNWPRLFVREGTGPLDWLHAADTVKVLGYRSLCQDCPALLGPEAEVLKSPTLRGFRFWYKNHENPRDQKSHTWAPLSYSFTIKIEFLYFFKALSSEVDSAEVRFTFGKSTRPHASSESPFKIPSYPAQLLAIRILFPNATMKFITP